MAEYIEREALLAEYDRVHKGPAGGARKLIVEAPAADVVEVVHSKWILYTDGSGECERCHIRQKNVWDYDNWQNYCGHCGAKMDGERRCEE